MKTVVILNKYLKQLTAGIILVSLAVTPTLAKHGSDDDGSGDRSETYGIIQSMPTSGLQGVWVIGGQSITANNATELDQTDGTLAVGACAKVKWRAGHVHEIDSEPMHDCR